ncbi:DUF5776 domain-containing protein [Viridibacillus sp. NPDC096237]|uniref:DUF5776 domain-containing protein n=1 Tax=Viridibacillus sp. NPDC096237 TaxID=3390721 RepID=UPI003CFFE5F6
MKKKRIILTLVCMIVICSISITTLAANNLAPANPDSTTEWEKEEKEQYNMNVRVQSAEPVIADISKWQYLIDWATASKVLDLAIIRTQYGSGLEDTYHKIYEAGALQYGVPFGVYSYSMAKSTAEARIEANTFYDRANKNAKFYVIDIEETATNGESVRDIINAYVAQLRTKTDKKIGVYIAHHLYKQLNIDTTKFDFVWIPRYSTTDTPPDYEYHLWQYTDKGTVLGINTNVDLNRLNPNVSLDFFTKENSKPVDLSNYYTKNPKKVSIRKKVNQYTNKNFTTSKKAGSLSKNTIVEVKGIDYSNNGLPRLVLANGMYITASKSYVVKLISNIDDYYTAVPKNVVIKNDVTNYSSTSFTTAKKVSTLKKGKIVSIADIDYTKGGTPRLKTTSGTYVTANKKYVLKTTANIANYITVKPIEVKTVKKIYQYKSTSLTSANRDMAIAKGKMLKVSAIVYTKGGTPRLKLPNGYYTTANKSYVQ